MRTSNPVPAEPGWFFIDASGRTLGRLATRIAHVLRGKHKSSFSMHAVHGDHVIVVNAGDVVLQGKKREEKFYVRHTKYLGHVKQVPLERVMAINPSTVLLRAVRGMLPRNRLRPKFLEHLHLYGAPSHPHAAQKPQPLDSIFSTPPLDKLGVNSASSEVGSSSKS